MELDALGLLGWAFAGAGWTLAVALAVGLRRRLSLVADAEHELRGAAAAIALAVERMRRTGSSFALSSLVGLQLDRLNAGLADLEAASRRRAAAPHPDLDAERLAQVLANLIANAAEHGTGPVEVRSGRGSAGARLEIRNRTRPRELDELAAARAAGRGRGLAIAQRAASELGGRLQVESEGDTTVARLELPLEGAADGRAA